MFGDSPYIAFGQTSDLPRTRLTTAFGRTSDRLSGVWPKPLVKISDQLLEVKPKPFVKHPTAGQVFVHSLQSHI